MDTKNIYANNTNNFIVETPCDKYTYNGITEYGCNDFTLDKDIAKEEAKEFFFVYLIITFVAMFFGAMFGANIIQLFFMISPFIIVFTMFKYIICLENNKKVYSANKK